MIIKVQDHEHRDKFLIEAAFIEWEEHTLLNIYITSKTTKALGDAALSFTSIEDEPSRTLVLEDGDHVYIMNNEGKTIDSKHIVIGKASRRAERERDLRSVGFKTDEAGEVVPDNERQ